MSYLHMVGTYLARAFNRLSQTQNFLHFHLPNTNNQARSLLAPHLQYTDILWHTHTRFWLCITRGRWLCILFNGAGSPSYHCHYSWTSSCHSYQWLKLIQVHAFNCLAHVRKYLSFHPWHAKNYTMLFFSSHLHCTYILLQTISSVLCISSFWVLYCTIILCNTAH